MVQTATSNWQQVANGDQTTASIPSERDVIAAEIRWRGVSEEQPEGRKRVNGSEHTGEIDDTTRDTEYYSVSTPSPPSDAKAVTYTYLTTVDPRQDGVVGEAEIVYGASKSENGGQGKIGVVADTDARYESVKGRADAYTGYDSPLFVDVVVSAKVSYTVYVTFRTQDPEATVNNGATPSGPNLDDGETSSWRTLEGLAPGSNTFDHSVRGSESAEYQFRYTYAVNNPTPFGASAGTFGASITDETVSADRVPAAATTLSSLPDFSDQSGWLARLTTVDETTETFDATRLMGVDTNQEHTAAWGGAVSMPPIIDPDEYRGGSMELRYDGTLILRCPELTDRDEGDDGTITIKGLGPASELKASPVDRDFRGVLVTDAMRTLLGEDADIPDAQVTVHDAPDRPVTDQIVQSATTREEFAQVLSEAPRNTSSGQFTAATAPAWEADEPFAWSGTGGVETTQTCQFREGEAGALSGASRSSASGASGGSVATFASAGDSATYSFRFDHEIPEGELGVAIRARTRSSGSSRTTRGKVRAADSDLFSFLASDFGAAGTGYQWTHNTVNFQPGTDAFDLVIGLSELGTLEPDIDAIAVYDDRYDYFFDNSTDAADALGGPQSYPDTARLRFDPAPAGIVLDSTTLSATVGAAGDNAKLELAATASGASSSSTLGGTADSHTASFADTMPGVRPTVELSRYADGRTETPTQGNAPQTLTSIETTISGNAIPVIEQRSFTETTVFDAVQSLCRDYDLNWAVEHGNERGTFRIEIFKRGDPELRRQLPAETVVMDYSESATAENYANSVTVIGDRIPNGDGERYRWTERDDEEIDAFGEQPATPIENDDLESTNDCRSVARAELAKRLDEDERGGSLDIVPTTVLEPGYPYEIEVWEDNPDAPGWGESWGEAWGGVQEEFATLETATFSESSGGASADADFDVRSDLLAALGGN
jgi:hypothetical protein